MSQNNDEDDYPSEKRSWWQCIIDFETQSLTRKDWKNQRKFLFWCVLWALGLIASKWLLKSELSLSTHAQWAVALAPNIFGLMCIWRYLCFLREADELVQKIQMEGLTIGFGLGVIYGMAFSLLHQVDLLQKDYTLVVMLVGWSLGQLRAMRRYQ